MKTTIHAEKSTGQFSGTGPVNALPKASRRQTLAQRQKVHQILREPSSHLPQPQGEQVFAGAKEPAGVNSLLPPQVHQSRKITENDAYRLAQKGLDGSNTSLHYSPSDHHVAAIEIHQGPAARKACELLDVEGYSLDGKVAFRAEQPTKNVMAHEVYHAVMQQQGPTFTNGILNQAQTTGHEKSAAEFEQTGKTSKLPTGSSNPVPRLSFYRIHRSYRLADNYDVAVQDINRAKEIYATQTKIDESKSRLTNAQNSILDFTAGTRERVFDIGQQPLGATPQAQFIGILWDEIRNRRRLLRLNDTEPEVIILQQALTSAGYGGLFQAGVFDQATEDALKRYQEEVCLFTGRDRDGILGRNTLSVLDGTLTPYIKPRLKQVIMTNRLLNKSGNDLVMLNDCGACANSIMGTLNWRNLQTPASLDRQSRLDYDPDYYRNGRRNPDNPHPDEPVAFNEKQTSRERALVSENKENTILDWKDNYALGRISGGLHGVYTNTSGNRVTTAANIGYSSDLRNRILQDRFGLTYSEWQNPSTLSAVERSRRAREGGINEFALPPLGGAYTTVYNETVPHVASGAEARRRGLSEGEYRRGNAFHWGAVVMASGSDTVALDNYANVRKALFNNSWKVQMYGQAASGTTPNQSFHSRYGRPGYVGRSAVTVAAEPD